MPLAVKINVALREQNCQKIGSERVKVLLINVINFTGSLQNLMGKCLYSTSGAK